MESCPSCGFALPGVVRFCPQCGVPLAEPSPGIERKLVTILFADVSGSTTLAERLDPERFKDVMDAFFDAMEREIEAEGGTLEKFIGDALVAVFGVPAAHEDDPDRALRAALRMQDALQRLNESLRLTHGIELAIRVGVNTGEVVASTSPSPGRGIVAGDAVNVTARLEQAARPGKILVSERTAKAGRGFRFAEVGSLALKGKDRSVQALELIGRDSGPAARIGARHAPLVGRDQEMALLQLLCQRVIAEERPHLVTIYGDAGVGKTRLVDEFKAWASTADPAPRSVRGRCLPYGKGVTYWPLSDILKHEAGVRYTDPPDVALKKIEETALRLFSPRFCADPARATSALCFTVGLLGQDRSLTELEPRQVGLAISAAWRSFFSALAGDRPTIVIVEDIHWADTAMLELLEDLVDHAKGRLLFLCSARPELTARRQDWGGGRRNASTILLEPLAAPDAARLLDLLVTDALSGAIRTQILERAGGNPFFLEELIGLFLELLVAQAANRSPEGRDIREFPRPADAVLHIPDTVQGVLAARMDQLDPGDKRTLQFAAVVGKVFWSGVVARLLHQGRYEVEDALARLENRGLVLARLGSTVEGDHEYAFKHILTRDTAYESLPRRERATAHASVAVWMEEGAGERIREFVELLAHHYTESYHATLSDPGRSEGAERLRAQAFRYTLLAAQEALPKLALAQAERFAEAAAGLASDPVERSRAFEVQGKAYFQDSKGDEAWECLRKAVDLRLEGAPDDHATIAALAAAALEVPTRGRGTMRARLSGSEAEPYLRLGLSNAGAAGTEQRARLLIVKAFWPAAFRELDLSREEQAKRAGEEATEIALRLDRPDLASAALDGVANVHLAAGLWGQVDQVLRRRVKLTEALSDPFELADIYASSALAMLHIGRYADAFASADQGFKVAASVVPLMAQYCLDWRLLARFRLGDWSAFFVDVTLLQELLGDRRGNPPGYAADHLAATAFLHQVRDEDDLADRSLEELDQVEKAEERPGPHWVALRSLVLARRGAFAEAHAILDAAPTATQRFGRGLLLEARCGVLQEEQAWDAMPSVLTECRRHSEEAGLLALPLHADRLEGVAALAKGSTSASIPLLERASAGFQELGARWEVARADLLLAEAAAPVNREAARGRASEAERVFAELGSARELNRARELFARLG